MIGIIGSGNVGANTAFFLAEKGVDDVMLYDIRKGTAKGKALDMMEAAPIRGYRTQISGTDRPEDVLGCDIIIITAGAVRKPGMTRDALFWENKKIIDVYASKITGSDTKVIIVTEPVDFLTTVFARISGLPANQIMGIGGVLDATRLRFLIAEELKVSTENVSAQVIGRHMDDMIILKDYCSVSGISLDNFLSSDRMEEIFEKTRQAGNLIVDLARLAGAYYGPSAVVAEVAEAICHDTGRLLSVSHVLSGVFEISDVALSLPCVINKTGISRVIQPRLKDSQIKTLKKSADLIAKTIKEAD
ncbi:MULTISPECIES: malate dehydrogenase [Desulfobacula]|uniref:Mdh2: malate dehydrogenase n=2 Tax=Desulfobacula TaxID=28222 RepID=K0NHZ0_DESTT|nr:MULTISPECIES: malate dehydrogenase [Desulfobacula]CCK80986.1 Mdh2: malate dehydrogenase [Desulfobacula toluolica Tol2]SDT84970.1 malate dehydrogenase (NAD) [Desulfobacula phenolica]